MLVKLCVNWKDTYSYFSYEFEWPFEVLPTKGDTIFGDQFEDIRVKFINVPKEHVRDLEEIITYENRHFALNKDQKAVINLWFNHR